MSSTARRVAWEDPSAPFPANFGLTWWNCLISPERFFDGVSWDEPFARPLLYYLIVAILAGLLGLFWFAWGPWAAPEELGLTLEAQLLSFFLTPFAMLLALGLIALVQHLFVVLLAPGRRGLAATATVLCYASGVGLVTAVFPPVLGLSGPVRGVLGASYAVIYLALFVVLQLWYLVVQVIGIRQAHSTTTGRAAAIVLIPLALGLLLAVTLGIVALALLAVADFPV